MTRTIAHRCLPVRAVSLAFAMSSLWFVSAPVGAEPEPAPIMDASVLPPPPPGETAIENGGEAPALAEDEERLRRILEFGQRTAHAQAAGERGRWDEAIREYTAALALLPGEPTALLGRALARKERAGAGVCSRTALADLMELATEDPRGAWLRHRGVAVDWMGECGPPFRARRLALVRELAAEPPGSSGRPDDIRVTLVELLSHEGLAHTETPMYPAALYQEAVDELRRYRDEVSVLGGRPVARALRLAADLHREREELKIAAGLYTELLVLYPDDPKARDAATLLEEVNFAMQLRDLDKTRGFKPSEAANEAYTRGVAALDAGELGRAIEELGRAIDDSPWFPQAYYARGVALAGQQHFARAVDDLGRAVRMDPSHYQAHITLGMLYVTEFAGAEDAEAVRHLSAALRLRPDLVRLHLLLGDLLARSDSQQAREHYRIFVRSVAIDDVDSKRARKTIRELERDLHRDELPAIEPPRDPTLRVLEPDLQSLINEAYLRGTEQQNWAIAEEILLDARARFPTEPVVLNELARVVAYQDRPGDARLYWEQSLQMREDQVEVHERLGLLLKSDLPDEALAHLRGAADLGSLTARFTLAELLWQEGNVFEAGRQLDHYLAQANRWDLHYGPAEELRRAIDRRVFQFSVLLLASLAILISIPVWRLWRYYRGASLRQLLERAPKSFPEIASILSLVRHEILKHNTAFLTDVARALELDASDASSRARLLGTRLFGTEGEARGGVHGRFLGYLDELEKVARAHEVALNLRRKDPIVRPMIESFESLARWSGRMRRADDLAASEKLDLARQLNRAGAVLGRQAFEQLSLLLHELCITVVDPKLLEQTYDKVRGEQQFQDHEVMPLEVLGVGRAVRIFRTDLEDILVNVFRNSLRSTLQYAGAGAGLGVELATEVDDITGLESLCIRIKDRSPEALTNEMLRGRYVERGMGITVDLLSRYDGSISVESEPGWSKAVVIRFFILEEHALVVLEAAE